MESLSTSLEKLMDLAALSASKLTQEEQLQDEERDIILLDLSKVREEIAMISSIISSIKATKLKSENFSPQAPALEDGEESHMHTPESPDPEVEFEESEPTKYDPLYFQNMPFITPSMNHYPATIKFRVKDLPHLLIQPTTQLKEIVRYAMSLAANAVVLGLKPKQLLPLLPSLISGSVMVSKRLYEAISEAKNLPKTLDCTLIILRAALGPEYEQIIRDQAKKCKQSNKTVESYAEEIMVYSLALREYQKKSKSRFVSGLDTSEKKAIELRYTKEEYLDPSVSMEKLIA
jgi:hypothetical protein